MEVTAFSFQEVKCLQDYSVCGLVVYSCAIYLLQIKKKRKQLCLNYLITCGEKQQIYSCLCCIWSSRKFSRVIKVDDAVVRNLPMQETWVQSLDRTDPLEEEMATHSSILAWKIPWTERPGGLWYKG